MKKKKKKKDDIETDGSRIQNVNKTKVIILSLQD